jgi:hypothetical protein
MTAMAGADRRLAAALHLSEAGFGILETLEGQKRPLGENWQELWVRDAEAVKRILSRPKRQFGSIHRLVRGCS